MSIQVKRSSYEGYLKAQANLESALINNTTSMTFIYGKSEVLIDLTLTHIREFARAHNFQCSSIESSQFGESYINLIANQPSLFEPLNITIIWRCEQSKSIAGLLKLFPAQQGNSYQNKFVFIFRSERLSESIAKECDRLKGKTIPCFDPWPNEIPNVINSIGKRSGLHFAPDAIAKLIEANGTDLIKHKHEITKLSWIFPAHPTPLTDKMITPLIGLLREDDAFQVDKLLLEGSWAKAWALVLLLLERGEKATAILGILAYHCRNVLLVGLALRRGVPASRLEVRIPAFILRNYLQFIGRLDLKAYRRALTLCRDIDTRLKTSTISEDLLLSQIISILAAQNPR